MSPRATTLIAAALCALCAGAAAVAAEAHSARHSPPPPATAGRGGQGKPRGTALAPPAAREHDLTVYPGPLPLGLVRRAIAWWNAAGAGAELTLTSERSTADVVIGPEHPLPGDVVGLTETPCVVPCRPDSRETITLSTRTDYNRYLTLVHELGHALGLAHSHTATCSVMAPVAGIDCGGQVPSEIPAVDRRALLAIWGPAEHAAGPSDRVG